MGKAKEKTQGAATEVTTKVADKIMKMNLAGKILLMAIFPLVIMVAVAMIAIQSTGSATAEKMAEQELITASFAVEMEMDALSPNGAYKKRGTELYRRNVSVNDNMTVFTNFQIFTPFLVLSPSPQCCFSSLILSQCFHSVGTDTSGTSVTNFTMQAPRHM